MDPRRHRFYNLWEDLLQKMESIREEHCPQLLDSFIAVFLHDSNWKRSQDYLEVIHSRQEMVKLIRSITPKIVILDVQGSDLDVDHLHPTNSGHIVIPRSWADRWDRAMDFELGCRLSLVLEAILKVILVHQLVHWLSAFKGSHTLLERFRLLRLDDTTKPVILNELGKEMDPGDYVEIKAGGGYAGFDDTRDEIYFQKSRRDDVCSSLETDFLLSIRTEGYAFYIPRRFDIEAYCKSSHYT